MMQQPRLRAARRRLAESPKLRLRHVTEENRRSHHGFARAADVNLTIGALSGSGAAHSLQL